MNKSPLTFQDQELDVEKLGIVQCDGYSSYPALARQWSIHLGSCMAHSRREIFEARKEAPQRAGWLLRKFAIWHKRRK